MIIINEKISKHVPGITSLFISLNNCSKEQLKAITTQLKTIPVWNYDPKTYIWEIPVNYLHEFIGKINAYDDLELTLSPYNIEPDIKYPIGKDYKTKLFDHQLDAIQFGLNNDKWLLLDAPGLGKTASLIYLAKELKEQRGLEHCLVICGINTLKTNWKKEIYKHSDLTARILGEKINSKGKVTYKSIPERVEELKNPIDEFFVIMNIENLRSKDIVKNILKNKNNKFDMIIVDEIHTCKSASSSQGAALLKLDKAKYLVGATGTLVVNEPLDTFVPLKWIGAERAAQSTCKYYYSMYGGAFGNEFLGYRNLDTLKQQLDLYTLRREKSLLNLPEQTIIEEFVDMPDKQKTFYENIKNGIIEQVDKVKLNAAMVLSLSTRLRQATACPSILTTEDIPSGKIDRCCDLVEQITSNGEKVVIFSTFKETVKELQSRLSAFNPLIGTGDIPDDIISQNVDEFQKDDTSKVFIGTWQKCGTGITLNKATYMIFIDTPWTPGQMQQACDRIHRIGTVKPVFIYNLIANDTFDERVLEIVNDKEAISDYLIDGKITQKHLDTLKKYIEELR